MSVEPIAILNFTQIVNTLDFLFLKLAIYVGFVLLFSVFMDIVNILDVVHLVVELLINFTVVEE